MRIFSLPTALMFALLAVPAIAQQHKDDPLSGTWVGDFGPAPYDRNPITLMLSWDGKSLTGSVNPGTPGTRMYRNFEGFPIEKASFDSRTGTVKFEANYKPLNRRYVIEGKLTGNTMSGSWNRPDDTRDGDFKLDRK
jgi:hypothetical protein